MRSFRSFRRVPPTCATILFILDTVGVTEGVLEGDGRNKNTMPVGMSIKNTNSASTNLIVIPSFIFCVFGKKVNSSVDSNDRYISAGYSVRSIENKNACNIEVIAITISVFQTERRIIYDTIGNVNTYITKIAFNVNESILLEIYFTNTASVLPGNVFPPEEAPTATLERPHESFPLVSIQPPFPCAFPLRDTWAVCGKQGFQ
jgi:hypothetical protein